MNSIMQKEKEKLLKFIKNNDSKSIIEYYSPYLITYLLDYKNCMFLAYDMFIHNSHDGDIQEYAVKILLAIREHFQSEWHKDWKNDVFLGGLCESVWRYSQAYEYYRQAYEKLEDPPDELLLRIASFNSRPPGEIYISDEEVEALVNRALEKKVSYGSAIMMKNVFQNKGDKEKEEHWNTIAQQLERQNIHTDSLTPDIFQEFESS